MYMATSIIFREYLSPGVAGAQTCRSPFEPVDFGLLVLLASMDFEAQSSHPQTAPADPNSLRMP